MPVRKEKRFVKIPVNETKEEQGVLFYASGKLAFDLQVRVDFDEPVYYAYFDASNLLGMDVEVRTESGRALEFAEKPDEEEYGQPRPQMHFAAKRGWINDPNGLIYYEGKYHLFFQHNPVGKFWQNMHWGHAVSEDLVRWEEKPIALYPDENGTVWSGAAYEDKHNVTGLKENGHSPLLLFYTAAGGTSRISAGAKFTQRLAYSTDGGETFKKYPKPLIDFVVGSNRDPLKILYDEKHGKYVMPLYLEEDKFRFYRSDDLLTWESFADFTFAGDAECPDVYELTENGRKQYALIPASGHYLIGDLDAVNGFVPHSEVRRLHYFPTYAPMHFAGLDKVVRIAWNNLNHLPTVNYNCTMSTPCEVWLRDGVLRIRPIEEFTRCFRETVSFVRKELRNFRADIPARPTLAAFKLNGVGKVRIFGAEFVFEKERVRATHYSGEELVMPYGGEEITLITDDVGMEIYVGDTHCGVLEAFSDYARSYVETEGDGEILYLRIRSMK